MVQTDMQLYLAIRNNNVARVAELLKHHDLTANDFFNDTITFVSLAVLNGNETIVNMLVEHGADVNRLSYVDYKWPSETQYFSSFEPALITATRHGYANLGQLLLTSNAKINKTDSFSMTALHWAASLNLIDVVQVLVKHGANLNVLDLKNQTPLEKAIINGHTDIVRFFVQNFSLEHKYRDYLLLAIDSANPEIFSLIISQLMTNRVKYDLNLIDDKVGSLLHYAVILNNLNVIAHARFSELEFLTSARIKGVNSMHHLNEADKMKIIQLLIDNGVEINAINKYGETPLHMCRSHEVAQLLLDKGASMSICEVTGKMPFYSAICRANFGMCVELLKNGCQLDNIDKLGNSLLYTIIHSCNAPVQLILLLLEAGVPLDKEEWIQRRQYPEPLVKKYPKIFKAIEWRLKNPPSLKELARTALRHHLNKVNRSKSIVNSVLKLETILPSALQDYVLLDLNSSSKVNKNRMASILLK